MQLSDIGQWLGRVTTLPKQEKGTDDTKGMDKQTSIDASNVSKTETQDLSAEETQEVRLRDHSHVQYLAQKYHLESMQLGDWKNFQVDALNLGMLPMSSVLEFSRDAEPYIFRSQAENININQNALLKQPSDDVDSAVDYFDMEESLKTMRSLPLNYSLKKQVDEWLSVVQSVKAAGANATDADEA